MLWFFVLPALVFVGWSSWRLFQGLLHPKPSDVFSKIEDIRTARSTGDRWQAAYGMSQALQKMIRDKEIAALEPEKKDLLYREIGELLETHAKDARLKKYLLLTLGQMGEAPGLVFLEKHLQDADAEVRFYSAWGFLDLMTKNPSFVTPDRVKAVGEWTTNPDPAIRKISASWLVQQKDPSVLAKVEGLLADGDTEVRWNAAVALASEGRASAAPVLKEVFDLEKLRSVGARSPRDLHQLVAAAAQAARKLGDAGVLAAVEKLKSSLDGKNPESRAILSAMNNADKAAL
jgi:HEAT repeat protein